MGRNVHTSSLRIPIFRTRSPHIPFSNAYLSLRSDDAIRWLIEKKIILTPLEAFLIGLGTGSVQLSFLLS